MSSSSPGELAVEHLRYAEGIAANVAAQLPARIREELIAEVPLLLLEFARTYDPERGAAFRTYLIGQFRHRLIDHLRKTYGRTERQRARRGLEVDLLPEYADDVLLGELEAGYERIELLELCRELAANSRELELLEGIAADVPLAELGRRHGITESRVCQIVKGIGRRHRAA